jgi:hypothetical protein
MAEHRVSMLRSALRRRVDPALSRDPRVRAVVSSLATLPIAPAPDAAFRAELRAQLVAIAPRIVAESAAAPATTTRSTPAKATAAVAKTAAAADTAERKRRFSLGRPLAVTASLVAVLALLLGGAVWMSRKALPGDTLYGLKRAGESVQLATAGSDRDKAQDYLEFASTRAAEARSLLSQATATALGAGAVAGGRVSTKAAALITDTLGSSDSDVKAAARLLNGEAARSRTTAPLDTMTDWAPSQLTRLTALAAAMPAGALHNRTSSSITLVENALARSKALAAKVGCTCLKGARTDEFGPVPCSPCTKPAANTGTSGPTQPAGTSTRQRHATPGSSTSRSGGHQTATTTRGNSPPVTSVPKGVTTPSVPKVPVKLSVPSKPSLPGVSVGKCGVSVSLGGLGAGLGLCSPSVHVSLPK